MTRQEMQWAHSHDWCLGAYQLHGGWTVVARDDMTANDTINFNDYSLLREWAGY